MKITVNRALCDSNGNCASVAPELFVLNDCPDEALCGKAGAALRACPENALSLGE